MLIAALRRRGLARFGAALAFASALIIALTATPASAIALTAAPAHTAPSAAPAPVLANGTYRWQNGDGGGWCLAYNVEGRGFTRQESCSTNDDYTVFWDVVNTSGNNYEIINEHNGQCLTVYGDTSANGAGVFVYGCKGTTDQVFTLIPQTSTLYAGAYQLQNVSGGLCVAVGGASTQQGAGVIMWSCAQSGEFMWRPLN